MKGRASRAVYMRLQPSLLSPPSDPEEREKKKREQKKKKGATKKLHPFNLGFDMHSGQIKSSMTVAALAARTALNDTTALAKA